MLSYEESLKILKKLMHFWRVILFYLLGLHSKEYIQCAQLLSYPKEAEAICSSLVNKIKDKFKKIDLILSPALGGIVVGYEIGRQLNIKTIFAERESGALSLRRGFNIPKNSNVLIVEDVITTGKSALEVLELSIMKCIKFVGFACIIDRSTRDIVIKVKLFLKLSLK